MRSDRYKIEEEKALQKKRKKGRTLTVLLLLILLLIIAIPAAVYYSYKSTLDSLSVEFKYDTLKTEIGDEYAMEDCIKSSVGDITYSEDHLETDTAGDKEIVCTASKAMFGGLLKPSKEFTFKYSVEDKTDPIMLWSGDGAVVEKGTEFNISDVIGYGDNADSKPSVEYEGKVDTDTVGDYPLHVTVSDASGNDIDWDLTVHVVESIVPYEDSSERWDFSDFVKENAADGRHFGIDVSNWQDDIDFDAVKKAGCEFVIIRIGYSEDGSVTMDKRFKQNFEGARAAGLDTGIYLYSYDNSEDEARSAAKWIIEQLDGAKLDLPIVFDWEDFGQFQTYEMSFIELNKMYDAFAAEIESAGYKAMLYSSKNYLEKIWTDTDTRPVWLAHYTDKTDYKGPYSIWQASSLGKIDGISGAVDLDILYD